VAHVRDPLRDRDWKNRLQIDLRQ